MGSCYYNNVINNILHCNSHSHKKKKKKKGGKKDVYKDISYGGGICGKNLQRQGDRGNQKRLL